MAELPTLARPYAKAAFEYARKADDLNTWSSALAVVAAVSEQASVARLLDSPALMAEQKAAVLTEVCGDQLKPKVKAFVAILAENKRLGLLPTIRSIFENLKAQQEKFADVQLVSAFALDSNVEKALVKKLKTVLISDVSLNTEIDPSLLGGVVIRTGDTVIDGSVKGRLNKLAETFKLSTH